MGTAILYHFPPISKTVFDAEIKIKKQAGKYSLENPLMHRGDRSDCEPMIEAQVQRAVDEIISKLNGS